MNKNITNNKENKLEDRRNKIPLKVKFNKRVNYLEKKNKAPIFSL